MSMLQARQHASAACSPQPRSSLFNAMHGGRCTHHLLCWGSGAAKKLRPEGEVPSRPLLVDGDVPSSAAVAPAELRGGWGGRQGGSPPPRRCAAGGEVPTAGRGGAAACCCC